MNKFIKFYKENHKGHEFFLLEEIPEEVWSDFEKMCRRNDPRLGYFIYHSHGGNPLKFQGMRIGYYIRKPFHKWKRKKVYL